MVRAPVGVGSGAFVTSVAAHALLLGCGALLLSHSLRDRSRERAQAALAAPREVEVELPSFDPSAADSEHETETAPLEATPTEPGGGPLERHPDTERAG